MESHDSQASQLSPAASDAQVDSSNPLADHPLHIVSYTFRLKFPIRLGENQIFVVVRFF